MHYLIEPQNFILYPKCFLKFTILRLSVLKSFLHYEIIFISRIAFSIFGTGGWRGLAYAYFSFAPRDSCNSVIDFPGRLRYRVHDDLRFAAGKLSHRSEVGRAKRNVRGTSG